MKQYISRRFLEKEIVVGVTTLDYGIQVVLTGGDKSHVGAVSVVDDMRHLETIAFPNHKDHYIGNEWAIRLFDVFNVPVAVTVGIHYDNISADEIQQIIQITNEMLEEIIEIL